MAPATEQRSTEGSPDMSTTTDSTTDTTTDSTPVRVHADHRSVKHLGHWTTANRFELRARRGYALLDLRSPRIPAGDIDLHLDIDHALVKLLVPDDAVIERWDLR